MPFEGILVKCKWHRNDGGEMKEFVVFFKQIDWFNYGHIFMSGLIASLPSIVAVIGIIVNNKKAESRQISEKRNSVKLAVLEEIYSDYNKLSDDLIREIAYEETKLRNLAKEIIYEGETEYSYTYMKELEVCLFSLCTFAIKRKEMLKVFDIDLEFDTVLESLSEIYNEMEFKRRLIEEISKLYVFYYVKSDDFTECRKKVMEKLEEKRKMFSPKNDDYDKRREIYFWRKMKNRSFYAEMEEMRKLVECFNESEKLHIFNELEFVIGGQIKEISDMDISCLDKFETHLASEYKKTLHIKNC